MSSIAGMDIDEAAKAAAGNWRKFESFVWWRARDISDAADFAILYTKNRDSGLDEEDYSRREYEATLENITDAARSLRHDYDLPDGWEGEVFSWFWDHNQRAVENRGDDQGGYPSEADLEEAFEALGYARVE